MRQTHEPAATAIVPPPADNEAKWTRRHLLDVDDLSRDELDLLMEMTRARSARSTSR
jgi:hypothetical protein